VALESHELIRGREGYHWGNGCSHRGFPVGACGLQTPFSLGFRYSQTKMKHMLDSVAPLSP
jgi:hypothetical protein